MLAPNKAGLVLMLGLQSQNENGSLSLHVHVYLNYGTCSHTCTCTRGHIPTMIHVYSIESYWVSFKADMQGKHLVQEKVRVRHTDRFLTGTSWSIAIKWIVKVRISRQPRLDIIGYTCTITSSPGPSYLITGSGWLARIEIQQSSLQSQTLRVHVVQRERSCYLHI